MSSGTIMATSILIDDRCAICRCAAEEKSGVRGVAIFLPEATWVSSSPSTLLCRERLTASRRSSIYI